MAAGLRLEGGREAGQEIVEKIKKKERKEVVAVFQAQDGRE